MLGSPDFSPVSEPQNCALRQLTRDELKAKRFFDFVNPDDVGATQKATVTKMSRS